MISQKDLLILDLLFDYLQKGEFVTVETLSQKMGVSVRTVRNNLERIDYYLKSSQFPVLIRDRRCGISLDILPGDLEKAKKKLLSVSSNEYVLSKAERVLLIKLFLFDAPGYLTYDYLSQILCVSRKTVIDDVHALNHECASKTVAITGTKHGICLSGKEADIRSLIIESMLSLYSPAELWEILRDIYPNRHIPIEKKWHDLADSDLVEICEDELRSFDNTESAGLTDAQFCLIIVITSLSLKREAAEKGIGENDLTFRSDIPVIKAYLFRLEKRLARQIADPEKMYICAVLSHIFTFQDRVYTDNISGALLGNLIIAVSSATGKDYSEDSELQEGLSKHLSALIRNSFVPYEQPGEDLDKLISEHTVLYETIRQVLLSLENMRGADKESLRTESALLMLHFLASDERRRHLSQHLYKTIIVCNNGIGTCAIAAARIRAEFPQIQILSSCSLRLAEEEIRRYEPDFVVATVPFEAYHIPVIHISAMLPENDIRKIDVFLGGVSSVRRKKESSQNVWKNAMSLIESTCDVRDRRALSEGLSKLLHTPIPEEQADLLDTLTADRIQLNIHAENWEDAIRKSAAPLLGRHDITLHYIDCMIENVRKMGPYIVISKSIAMPHALSADGVNRTCMSLTTLAEPVAFGNKVNDPVRLILCIGTANPKSHMSAMSGLIEFISRRENIQNVLDASCAQDVLQLIQGR